MHPTFVRAVCCLTLGLLLSAALAAAEAPNTPSQENPLAGWSLEHQNFEQALASEKRVRIVNAFGNVYARTGDDKVEISTVAQRQDGDPYRLLLATRSDGDSLVVEVVARLDEGQADPDGTRLASQKRRLDLTLFQPAGVPLAIDADDSIETKKLRCDVDLVARKGHIFLDTFGHPRARAFDREIRGVLRGTRWNESGEISTRSGDIKLFFLDDADLAIEATTMGALTTDYSLTIERTPGQRRKKARARIGQGRAKLILESEAGHIQLLLNV